MPQPSTSIQPVRLQIAQPAPPHDRQPMNTSALGSVYGKKLGRNITGVSGRTSRAGSRSIVPFKSRHRHALADDEPLDLLEHRRVRQVQVVAAIHAARRDDPDGRPVRLHVADLHRGGVRAQQRGRALRRVRPRDLPRRRADRPHRARERLAQVQRVLHVARGVIRRHVERFEVVIVVLGLGAVEDLVPLPREDRLEALAQIVSGCRWPTTAGRPGSVTSTAPAGGRDDRARSRRSASVASM